MRPRTRVLSLVLLVAVVAVSSALAGGGQNHFTATATLDGKRVLPLRIRWRPRPEHVALARVNEVDYVIDDRRAWVKHHPPYHYGSNEGNYGNWLVISFLDVSRAAPFAGSIDCSRGRSTSPPTAGACS
jgi:hypothetical protein